MTRELCPSYEVQQLQDERNGAWNRIKELRAEVEQLRVALENAEQFLELFVAGFGCIEDGKYTLSHVNTALNLRGEKNG